MGALASGTAGVVGSGAFTSVEANRDLTIGVTGDASALLSIKPAEEGGSVTENADEYVIEESDGTIAIDLSSTSQGANGFNKDATTIIDALLDFTNQGTQPINVGEASPSSYPGSFYAEGEFGDGEGDSFDVDDFDNSGQVTSVDIAPGHAVENVGFVVTNPEENFNSNGSQTFEVTFKAVRVGGDRV